MNSIDLPSAAFRVLIFLLYGFLLLPVVAVTYVAFFDSKFLMFPPPGYTLEWFANVFRQRAFIEGFVTSGQVAFLASLIGVFSGTLAAFSLVYFDFPGRKAALNFMLAPLLVPGIVAGTALYIFYIQVGQTTGWFPTRSLAGLVIAHVVLTIPWSVRLIVASLGMLDRSIEEAARNLGASAWSTFWHVTLPRMRAGIVAAAIFSFVISFENLEVSVLLVTPGSTTLPIAMLQYLEFEMDPTLAAASAIQIAIVAILLLVSDRYVKLSRVV